MPRRAKHSEKATDEPQQPAITESRYRVEHYGESRNFAVYERETLIAVTLYRKGAQEITARLEERNRRIADLERQLAAVPPPLSPALPSAEPPPAPAWRPPQQLGLLAAEDMATYRATSPRRRLAPAPRRS